MQQHLGGRLDVCGILCNLIGDVLAKDHLIQCDYGIDRRSDLVAHAGEKVILRFIERLNLLFLSLRTLHLAPEERIAEVDHDAHADADQHQCDQ